MMKDADKNLLISLLPLIGLALLYLITRLTGLTVLPMISQEATFIHWAQIIHQYPGEWLIPGVGGQQPLFMWLNAITLGLIEDPLAAGRWVSVLAGLVSMAGLYWTGRDLFNPTAGVLASLIYIVTPYTFFFDRMALADGCLSALGIWMFRWTMHIVRESRPFATGMRALGILMGLALLTHWRAVLIFPVPLGMLYFYRVHQRPEFWKHFWIGAGSVFVLNLPAILGGRLTFVPVADFWLGPAEWAALPWVVWMQNLMVLRDHYVTYLTLPLNLVLIAALVYLFRERQTVEKWLWGWFVFPVVMLIFFANGVASHYGLIGVAPLILLAAVACDRLAHFILVTLRKLAGAPHHARIKERAAALTGLMLLVLFSGVSFDRDLIGDPHKAPLPEKDRSAFLFGPHSGYGVREAADFLSREAEAFHSRAGHPLPVLLPMNQGHPGEGVAVYLWKHPDIWRVPAFWWPREPKIIPRGMRFSHRPSIYQVTPMHRRETTLLDYAHFVFPSGGGRDAFLKENPRFMEAWKYQKPETKETLIIYKRRPPA